MLPLWSVDNAVGDFGFPTAIAIFDPALFRQVEVEATARVESLSPNEIFDERGGITQYLRSQPRALERFESSAAFL